MRYFYGLLFILTSNHYHVLGLTAAATAPDIKAAYKRLAVRYHPDKHRGSTQYEEQFKAVSTAYRVLSNPGRRAAYDYQLQQADQRAAEQRRQQQYRPQGQHVYGVPMPPPAPLRTRPPANAAERHYRPIPRQRARFTRRDYALVVGLVMLLGLLFTAVKVTMDHVTAVSNYKRGLAAYSRREWSTAHSFLSEALHFKPTYAAARQRRGEIEQYVYHNYAAARADYLVALGEVGPERRAAGLWFRLGQCEQALGRPPTAARCLTRALQLDSTLSAAHLLRGEIRLFAQRRFAAATADLSAGLRQQVAAGWSPSLQALTYRGLAYAKQDRFAQARADYRQVLATTPRNGQVYFLLGRLAQREGNVAAACAAFHRAAQLDYGYAAQAERELCGEQ